MSVPKGGIIATRMAKFDAWARDALAQAGGRASSHDLHVLATADGLSRMQWRDAVKRVGAIPLGNTTNTSWGYPGVEKVGSVVRNTAGETKDKRAYVRRAQPTVGAEMVVSHAEVVERRPPPELHIDEVFGFMMQNAGNGEGWSKEQARHELLQHLMELQQKNIESLLNG